MDIAIEHDNWIRSQHSSVVYELKLDTPVRRALEAAFDYRTIPIRSLVGLQGCAGLAAAAYLNS